MGARHACQTYGSYEKKSFEQILILADARAWCMPVRGVFYRNGLPEQRRCPFLWDILGVPHPSEVPDFFSKSPTRKPPCR